MTFAGTTQAPDNAAAIRLPARLDTLAALWLAAELRRIITAGGRPVIDAGGVGDVGLVALQLLRATAGACEMRDAGTLDEAWRDAGLCADAVAPTCGRVLRLRFDDSALLFGGDPLAALGALRAAGAGVAAVPAPGTLDEVFDAPDRLRMTFRITLPDAMAPAAVEAILAPFEDSATLDWPEPGDDAPPATSPAATPVAPPGIDADDIVVTRGKLDALGAQVADLAAAQSALVERMGMQAGALAAEIVETERRMRALQDGVVALAMSRIDALVNALGSSVAVDGGETEIHRAVIDRIAVPLAALLATPGATLAATTDGSFVTLRMTTGAGGDTGALRDAARALGGRMEAQEGGRLVTLRLPRSLMMLDAFIVEVGATGYAIPVDHVIEALRPPPDDLRRLGPGRSLLRFRDRYVPIVALGDRFGNEGWERDPCAAVLVVVHAGDTVIALMADTISDQRQVTGRPLASVPLPPGIAGAAIVGGRIALTLDLLAFEPPADDRPD